MNTKDNFGKFNEKIDEGIFLGYATSSKLYRVFNKRRLVVEESMHIVFNETNPFDSKKVVVVDVDDIGILEEQNQQQGVMKRDQDSSPQIKSP